jgi:DeoR/GlpR family transcriptional regulator of sugar metabolism
MGQVTFVNVVPLQEIDLIVTNASPHNHSIKVARELGVEILHVEPVAHESVA